MPIFISHDNMPFIQGHISSNKFDTYYASANNPFINTHRCHPPIDYSCYLHLYLTDQLRSIIKLRSEEHTPELQSRFDLVCRLRLENERLHRREAGAEHRRP